MKKTILFPALVAAVVGLALVRDVARAEPAPDVHRARFACTTCHVSTPAEGATIESAPLVMAPPDLCLACHGDTHDQ